MIIHLLNRRRFRTVKWAATTFLLRASRESRGKKKLKHLLILACRALAIAALIFAVARPLVGGFLGSGSGSVGTVLLVLDRSASMETKAASGQPSHRESVLNKISASIEKIGSPRLVLLDSASGEIQDIPDPEALTELSITEATDTEADIPTLLIKAITYLEDSNPGPAEIWLASDLQRNDWRPSDSRWEAVRSTLSSLPSQTKLRILTAGSEVVENFALELLASRRIEDELFLDLKLSRREGKGSTTVPITYSLKGARSSERVTITGQELRFQKRIPLAPTDAEGHGWIGLPADNNPRDNSVYFAFGGKEAMQTWIISDEPASEIAEYLRKAAAPAGFERYSASVLSPTQTTQIDWSSASLIIWQAPLPSGAVASQLSDFASSGGSVLFFPPTQKTGNSTGNVIFGTAWGDLQSPPAGQFFINGSWLKDDGPWKNGRDGSAMPIEQIRAVQRRAISGEGSSLADWDDGSPLLYRQLEGQGTAIFIGTLPDERWSNIEFIALHLVTIQRLIEKGSDRLHAGYRATVGRDKAMAKGDEVRERLDSFEDFEPALGGYRAGVYRLGERTVAVNRPVGENFPERVEQSALEQLLAGSDFTLFENDERQSDLVAEAWRAFLIAVLLFLIAEALLCLQPKRSGPPIRAGSPSAPSSSAPSSSAKPTPPPAS